MFLLICMKTKRMGFGAKIKRAIKNPEIAIKGTYQKIDQSAGKAIFGNTVGMKHNLRGTINLMKNTRSNIKSNDPLIEQFKANGYLKLEFNYDKSLIDKIRTKYDKMIEDDKFSYGSGQHNGKFYKRQLIDAHLSIPELSSLLTDELIKIVEQYYGGYFHVVRIDLWRNYHIPPEFQQNDLISNVWHCDNRKTDRLKLFVNLSDVTEKDGPFHLQSIPRTKELMKMKFNNRVDYGIQMEVLEDPKHVVKFTGPSGSAILGNTTTCLHKAGNPQTTRDMIQFLFRSSEKPLSKDWIKDVIHVGPDAINTTEE